MTDLEHDLEEKSTPSLDTSDDSLLHDAHKLCERFKERGDLVDLEGALRLARRALELYPHGHPYQEDSMYHTALYLSERFDQLGNLSDLEEAIAILRSISEPRPPAHHGRAVSLRNLACYLCYRFKQLGDLSDLDEAVSLGRTTLELCPPGHPERVYSLRNVAFYLTTRFKHIGALRDLEESIALRQIALELPSSHRDVILCNLSTNLSDRFKLFGELSDLEKALVLQRAALELRSQGHPNRTFSLGYIAENLHLRFKRLCEIPDLEESLVLQHAALQLRPGKHPYRAASLSNIASCLCTRFGHFGAFSDLDEAVSLERSALGLRPKGHPSRTKSLGHLAHHLHTRFKHTGDIVDLDETFDLYSQLSDVSQQAFLGDAQCANQWIQAAEEHEHRTTLLSYQTFMHLADRYLATLPPLPQHLALLKQLMKSTAADAFSAGIRYGNLSVAVQLLEQGRAIFWRQLVRLRSPLDDVRELDEAGKVLADRFNRVAGLLRGLLDGPFADSQHDRAFHLNKQLQDVIGDIRKLPGLAHFLQSPSFSDFQVAAIGGPVIIVNASHYGCNAVVLLSNSDLIHVPLLITSAHVTKLSSDIRSLVRLAKFREVRMNQFGPHFRELWDLVVFPIVQVLKDVHPRGLRVWWCPTGEFSLMPMHAAGSYRTGDFNFSDYYISSYTPTLSALIRARQRMSIYPSVERLRFLLVGQAEAPGQKKLVSVDTELSNVVKRVGGSTEVTRVQNAEAHIERVGKELNRAHMAHFACHGIPDPKRPFESGFGLGDGLLKIEKIMQYDLKNATFAYLSACHTTIGDQDSPDEAIHLAAAMQFAGFGSVIGTMWAVDDSLTDGIASKFYDYMKDEDGNLDPSRAAVALHLTMRSLFVPGSKIPFDQRIVYVHIGP